MGVGADSGHVGLVCVHEGVFILWDPLKDDTKKMF